MHNGTEKHIYFIVAGYISYSKMKVTDMIDWYRIIKDIAERLNITERQVQYLCANGKLKTQWNLDECGQFQKRQRSQQMVELPLVNTEIWEMMVNHSKNDKYCPSSLIEWRKNILGGMSNG